METKAPLNGYKHKGKQIKRFREAIGMKQESLALTMKTSQQKISNLENQKDIDDELFAKLANSMGVSPEVLKNFNAEDRVNIFSNNFYDHSMLNGVLYNPTFNSVGKTADQFSKIEELYEKLLQSEREKVELLIRANQTIPDLVSEIKELLKELKKK